MCLVVFVCCFLPCLVFSFGGVVFGCQFLVSCLVSNFSDLNSALRFGVGGFCLESLILAQDERWRRA